jgi:predicted nucleic-acid-binding Zn-ribbon protein
MPSTTKELSMDKQRQEQIISALKEKGAVLPCPRCRNLEFEVIGEGTIIVSPDKRTTFESVFQPLQSNPEVPVVLVSCTRCGYIAQHAARLLDLKR